MSVTTFDPTAVRWEEPPPRSGGGLEDPYATAFIDSLKEKPGEWAIFREDAITGKVADLRARAGVQVTSRPNKDADGKRTGTSTVWARWVGLDENGKTNLSPEQIARREARAAAKAARDAEDAAEPF